MPLLILRLIFVMVATGLGVSLLRLDIFPSEPAWLSYLNLLTMIMLAVAVIVIDIMVRKKRVDVLSAVYFGLIVGLFLAYLCGLALEPLFPSAEEIKSYPDSNLDSIRPFAQITLSVFLCYMCMSFLLQTQGDFRFIIPYVEFSKETRGHRPYILDTSVVIDGRIADVIETRLFDSQLIMPRFVINELQGIADSSDRIKRGRGRRGLDILNQLRNDPEVDLNIFDRELPEFANQPVDMKLVLLAKHVAGKLVTNDYNLNKVARLHGVSVMNLNDLANALKPTFLPGEHFQVQVVKVGEEPGQGIGYLDDGTMVVVESGRDQVDKTIPVIVTSVLQTSAGRMIFTKLDKD
jgi:uncharacterized protein YacL